MIFLEAITNNRNALSKLNFGQWTDTYGNKFFSSKGAYQKIRIDKSYDEEYNNDALFNLVYTTDTGSAWSMPKGATTIVNNKNYNLIIRKDNHAETEHIDKHLIYIVLDRSVYIKRNSNSRYDKNEKFDNLKINMISYQPYFPVSHTFTTRDGKYVGCIMIVNDLELSGREVQPIIDIDIYNAQTKKYSTVSITYNSLSKMMTTVVEEPNSVKLYELKSLARSYNNEHQPFSVSSSKGEPITAAIIASPKYTEAAKAFCDSVRNSFCLIYNTDFMDVAALKKDIADNFIKKGYKVVTLMGLSGDQEAIDAIENGGFFYIFNYYPEDKSITCIKSM